MTRPNVMDVVTEHKRLVEMVNDLESGIRTINCARKLGTEEMLEDARKDPRPSTKLLVEAYDKALANLVTFETTTVQLFPDEGKVEKEEHTGEPFEF